MAPSLDAVKALPALVVEPADASWLDASTDSGPGRMICYGVTVHVVTAAPEPVAAMAATEDAVERVLERIPSTWRFNRANGPQRIEAPGGELTAYPPSLAFSMRYSITAH